METETIEIKGKRIEIQRFNQSLYPEFIKLLTACFGVSWNMDKLSAKYDTKALGGKHIGYMAFHNDIAIAYYGVLPVPFVLEGRPITAVQSADTMTHPDYRRHGLFPLLAKKTYELASIEGASFVFGWPNQNSYPSFKNKLGWRELGNMQKFSIQVTTLPVAKVVHKLPFLKSVYMPIVRLLLGHTHEVSVKPLSEDNYLPRTSPYVNYKRQLGAFGIETEFGNLLVSVDYRLKLGDLSTKQLSNFQDVLNTLKRKCQILGITEVQIISSQGSTLSKKLEQLIPQQLDDLPLMYWPFTNDVEINHLNLTGLDYDGF